jgi:electron transport complex protein RnfG
MKSVFNIALRLVLITAVAGLLLGLTYSATAGPIEQQQAAAASESRRQVLADATDFEEIDLSALSLPEDYSVVQEAYWGLNSGEKVGITVYMIVKGYSAGLNITVGVNEDGTVSGVVIGSHSETPGLGAKAADATVVKTTPASPGEVQAVTGATITSTAVANAVNMAVDLFDNYVKEGAQ